MKIFATFLVLILFNTSYAKEEVLMIEGSFATPLIQSYQKWVGEHPAYEATLTQGLHCKLKAPKKRSWGYASCTNNSWYSSGNKSTSLFAMAIIDALPDATKETLHLSASESRNNYIYGITVNSIYCDEIFCEVVYDPDNQDRSHLSF